MAGKQPTEAFYKAKRAALLVGGALAVYVLLGVEAVTDGKLNVGPFTVTDPQNISDILFVALIYCVWQLFAAWATQDQDAQAFTTNRADAAIAFALCVVAATIYANDRFLSELQALIQNHTGQNVAEWITVGATAVAALSGAIMAMVGAWRLRKKLDRSELVQEVAISRLVTSGVWTLWFNPAIPGAKKLMTFLEDGEIGMGKNANENRWIANNGFLEFINSDGKVFSRFRYNVDMETFYHTNDADTLSIRGQRLFRYGDSVNSKDAI